jgi:lysophospholipase L1-like esterase
MSSFCRRQIPVAVPLLFACLGQLTCASAPGRAGDIHPGPIRVACVGDSITAGACLPAVQSYPSQLGRMLGNGFLVGNFGHGGAAVQSYADTRTFQAAKLFQPDIIIIMLGTNDTTRRPAPCGDHFVQDYEALIAQFASLPSRPRIFCCLPPPVRGKGMVGINEAGVKAEIPLIAQIAEKANARLLDTHSIFANHLDLLPDNVHPNVVGANLIAETVFQALHPGQHAHPGHQDEPHSHGHPQAVSHPQVLGPHQVREFHR